MSLNTTPRTWVANEIVTAAEMNTEVRDALTGIQAAWSSYTPTWTASTTNPTLGNGTLVGLYLRIGETIFFSVTLTFGSTTNAGSGNYSFALPVNSSGINTPLLCNGRIPGSMPGGILSSATTFQLANTSTGALIGSSTISWATGNVLWVAGMYQAA